jgi:hypothetical protein
MRSGTHGSPSWAQRVVACLLLSLVLILIVNPIFECHDHLDNLSHLGSRGVLVTLLLVASAGTTLVRSVRLPWRRVVLFILSRTPIVVYALERFELPSSAAAFQMTLPLRI